MGNSSENTDAMARMNRLIGVLIGLARATDGNEHLISESSTAVIVDCLSAMHNNVVFDEAALERYLHRVSEEKRKMVPNCFTCAAPCGRTAAYDLQMLQAADPEIREMKMRLLGSICRIAADIRNASVMGCDDADAENVIYKALIVIGMDDYTTEDLLPIMQEVSVINRKSREREL